MKKVAKTGRTHLMDAMPVTFGQELGGWSAQIRSNIERLDRCAQAHAPAAAGRHGGRHRHQRRCQARAGDRGRAFAHDEGPKFESADNYFEGISSQDAAVELSGQLKTLACSLMKIANDLRWMNSGPLAGLGEIELPALQPGSSIMPGKVNPVIPEAMTMVCAQVIGNDATITIAGQSGNFQLNVMLPVIALNLLQSIEILANAVRLLADKAIAGFKVREDRIKEALDKESDSGHGIESGDRLRKGRGDGEAGVQGGPPDSRRRAGDDGSVAQGADGAARSADADQGRHPRRFGRRLTQYARRSAV